MTLRLTILCENSVGRPLGLIGEHGFACFLQTPSGDFLFDTGSGLGIDTNADLLNLELADLRGIILSHGHYDHVGGLAKVLARTGPINVYAHPDLFSPRVSLAGEPPRQIGVPDSREQLEQLGARFLFSRAAVELTPELTISGEIPRTTDFEQGDPNLCCADPNGIMRPDPLADDLSLFIKTARGLTVLLGCAHAGLINILDYARQLTGEKSLHTVVGGTHLLFYDDMQFRLTLERLEGFNIERLGAAHCTGLQQAARLAAHFGDKFFFAAVGTALEI
ncbi:MAG: MBL fold metallo-hydrolase [Desulfuromonadales bacterium]|nr:MBL fold metallo-hydrolase [Desulfuromonadales bacterium]